MKIAVVCPDDLSIVLFCKGIIRELQRNGNNEVTVLCDVSTDNRDGYYSQIIASWGVRIVPVPFYRFISPLKDAIYFFNLYRIFRREKYEAVLNISTKPNIYGSIAAKWARVKMSACAVWGMGSVFQEDGAHRQSLMRGILLSLYRIAFHLSDKIWFTNENDCRYFVSQGMLLPEKSILTKNYLDTREYSCNLVSSEQLDSLKKEFGLSSEHKVVVMIARMAWAKGIKEFIEASQSVIRRIPETRFFLVGPVEAGSPENVPEAYLKEKESMGSFKWLGFRRDIKALYALADLAVLPSYYREGGYPRGITEAMSMGKPVITTDSIHCRATVEDGKNGYLVPIKDSSMLADAIVTILVDEKKCKAFGKYSRQKAVKEFDENAIVPDVIKKIFFNSTYCRCAPAQSNQ